MKKILTYSIVLMLVVGNFGCKRMKDLVVGGWQTTDSFYNIDSEGSPLTYKASISLELNQDKTYTMQITYLGNLSAELREFITEKQLIVSDQWVRNMDNIELKPYGIFDITYFDSNTLQLQGKWPLAGRQIDELQLGGDERKEAMTKNVELKFKRK